MSEISKIYGVSNKTVSNWYNKLKISHRTRGGKMKTFESRTEY